MKWALYRQRVELERPVLASEQRHHERSRLFLRVHDGSLGYGEVAPQPTSLHGDPGVDDVVEATYGALSRIAEVAEREGALPAWSRVGGLFDSNPASRVASALIEMALLDRELREREMSISELWPPVAWTPQQRTVSALDDAEWALEGLYARVRVKTKPGPVSERALEQLARLTVPVLLDFNCSATCDDDVLSQVKVISEVAMLDAVEQPYAVGNVVDHARLAARLEVDVSVDEGVRTTRDLIQIARYEAARMVCVKPARVGGLANARSIIARGKELGLRVYVGGFFESPYGRHVHGALANGAAVDEASDLGVVALDRTDEEIDTVSVSFGVEPSASMLEKAESLTVR